MSTSALFIAENLHQGIRYFIHLQVLKLCEPLASFNVSPQCPHGDFIIALLLQPTKQASGLINSRNVSADETFGLEYDSFVSGYRKGSGRSIGFTVSMADRITIPLLVSFGDMFWPLQ